MVMAVVVAAEGGSRTDEAVACRLANGDGAKHLQSAKEDAKAAMVVVEGAGEEAEGGDAGGGSPALPHQHPQFNSYI